MWRYITVTLENLGVTKCQIYRYDVRYTEGMMMAQEKPKYATLTPADKRTLSEIQQLEAMMTPKLNDLGQTIWSRWSHANQGKVEAGERYLRDNPLPHDIVERETSWNEQYDYVETRFYSVTALGTGDIFYVRNHDRGRADDRVSNKVITDILRNKFLLKLHTGILMALDVIIPPCVAREYMPSCEPTVLLDFAKYANTWVPPKVKPSGETVSKRPALWQEYLDRLIPQEHECWFTDADGNRETMKQQDYLEKWLAQRVRYPQTPNNVAVVLRGDFGTGKGVWLDEMASKLIGDMNYKSVSTKDWKGDFNADMFESVIIHLEETKDTRQNTGEMLKKLITQNRHRANEKNIPQRQVYKHFAIVITSNYLVPIVIDKGDRRYFVPVFSKHLHDDGEGMAGKNETGRFIQRFVDWLYHDDETGFQIMRDWLEGVKLGEDGKGFMMPPDTPDKAAIWLETRAYDSVESDLGNWLLSHEDSRLAFSATALAKHHGISDGDAQAILKKYGYVPKQINLGKELNARFWVPRKHEDTRAWRKKGWSVWQSHGLNTELGGFDGGSDNLQDYSG